MKNLPIFCARQSVIGTSVLVGGVSIRQVRVREETCSIPYQRLVDPQCRYGYSAEHRDRSPLVANGTWYYGDSHLTRSDDVTGQQARYDGGGYQVILPGTRSVG